MTNEKAKEIDLGGDFGAAVLKLNSLRLEVSAEGKNVNIVSNMDVTVTIGSNIFIPPKTSTAIANAQKALEIGQKMKDGTVVIAIDLQKNLALFVPEGIFGVYQAFNRQDDVVKEVNKKCLAGHKDWRRMTDEEARVLARDWDKVAPPEFKGSCAPLFWGAATHNNYDRDGYLYSGWEADSKHLGSPQNIPHRVPVIRSGPAVR